MSRNAFDTPSLYEQIIATITNPDFRGMLIWHRCFWCLPITSSRPQKVRVLCTKYGVFFFYIFDNIIWFSKSSLRSHKTTSTTTNRTLSPWHCHTAGAKTKIYKHQKIIDTIATFTLLPQGPLSLPHSHSAINIIVAIIYTSITISTHHYH